MSGWDGRSPWAEMSSVWERREVTLAGGIQSLRVLGPVRALNPLRTSFDDSRNAATFGKSMIAKPARCGNARQTPAARSGRKYLSRMKRRRGRIMRDFRFQRPQASVVGEILRNTRDTGSNTTRVGTRGWVCTGPTF